MSLPIVTDHAVVRYCERVLGLDMEGVRRRIAEQCQHAGTATAVHCGSFIYQMGRGRDGKAMVITVRPKRGKHHNGAPRPFREAAE